MSVFARSSCVSCWPCSLVAAHSQPASEPSGQTETHRHNALDIHTYSHYTLSFLSPQSRHPQHASESTTTVSPSHPTKQSTTSTQRKEAPLGRHTSDITRRLGELYSIYPLHPPLSYHHPLPLHARPVWSSHRACKPARRSSTLSDNPARLGAVSVEARHITYTLYTPLYVHARSSTFKSCPACLTRPTRPIEQASTRGHRIARQRTGPSHNDPEKSAHLSNEQYGMLIE